MAATTPVSDLEREKFNWFKSQVDRQNFMQAYWAMQDKDFAYVKLTVAIVLLIVILYYLSCHFGFRSPKSTPPSTVNASATAPVPVPVPPAPPAAPTTERFSPYVSTLVHDEQRSDAAGDVPSANPPPTRPETALFDQIDGWAILKPLKVSTASTPIDPSKYSDPVSPAG